MSVEVKNSREKNPAALTLPHNFKLAFLLNLFVFFIWTVEYIVLIREMRSVGVAFDGGQHPWLCVKYDKTRHLRCQSLKRPYYGLTGVLIKSGCSFKCSLVRPDWILWSPWSETVKRQGISSDSARLWKMTVMMLAEGTLSNPSSIWQNICFFSFSISSLFIDWLTAAKRPILHI